MTGRTAHGFRMGAVFNILLRAQVVADAAVAGLCRMLAVVKAYAFVMVLHGADQGAVKVEIGGFDRLDRQPQVMQTLGSTQTAFPMNGFDQRDRLLRTLLGLIVARCRPACRWCAGQAGPVAEQGRTQE